MQINGVSLTEKQACFYKAIKAKDGRLASKFLADIRKKQEQAKGFQDDEIYQLRKEAVSIDVLPTLDNRGVHNFSIGCLDAYFYLGDYVKADRAFLFRGRVLVTPSKTGGWKAFVYEYVQEDLRVLQMIQGMGIVYSLSPIPGLPKQSKFKEMAYDLDEVFDPASYPNTKKRKNKIRHPLTYIKNTGFVIESVSPENLGDCRQLHDKWVDWKLADERTFQIMFPRHRYYRCAEKAAKGLTDELPGVRYEGRAFRLDGDVVGVNIMSVERNRGYGLAMFGNTWDPKFNRLMGATDLWYFKKFLDDGVRYYNAGTTVNADHKSYKARYPHKIVESYAYGRVK